MKQTFHLKLWQMLTNSATVASFSLTHVHGVALDLKQGLLHFWNLNKVNEMKQMKMK